MKTVGPTPSDAARDLGLEMDRDAALMVDRALRLARVHEKAIHREVTRELPIAEESKPCP